MDIKFSFDGLIEGGIECVFQNRGISRSEDVWDLVKWIKNQFQTLRNLSKQRVASGDKKPMESAFIWIGESEMPFAFIWANRSKLTVNFIHPEHTNKNDDFFSSTNVDIVSDEIVKKLRNTKTIAWTQSML